MTDSQNTTETSFNNGPSNTLRIKDSVGVTKAQSVMAQVLKKEERNHPKKKKEALLSHLKKLEELYPKLFDRHNPKPLKIKIHEDILHDLQKKQVMTASQVRSALRFYTRNPKYLLSITESNVRYDLNSEAAGEILPEHKTDAKEMLERKKEKKHSTKQKTVHCLSLLRPTSPLSNGLISLGIPSWRRPFLIELYTILWSLQLRAQITVVKL